MTTVFREVQRPRLYEQVVVQLREHIAAEGLRSGDRLPAERRLAELLGVSRTSVRQAVLALESRGVVEVRHGSGTFLRADVDPSERTRAEVAAEAHRALAGKLAELAAQHRTEADLARLREALRTAAHSRFHAAVAESARNELLAEFARQAERDGKTPPCPGNRPAAAVPAEHARIVEAIEAGDAAAAARRMSRHINESASSAPARENPASVQSGHNGGVADVTHR